MINGMTVPANNRLQRRSWIKCEGTYGSALPLNRDVRPQPVRDVAEHV